MIFERVVSRPVILVAVVSAMCGALAEQAGAQRIDLARPADREFVRDLAEMVSDADESVIRELCGKLLTETGTPIIVVTIESMSRHGGADLRIETFARLLFDEWEIGHEKINQQLWNTGILLLVSDGDRKARIELGAGWRRDQDHLAQRIMDEQIVARFKQHEFSRGIVAGVEALAQMARGKPLPGPVVPPRPAWHYLLIAGAVAMGVFTIVSLVRRGGRGWAWVFWGVVFSALGVILYQVLSQSRRGRGSFSGGSFGGGFSGGGGATGSW
ncbi:MAG: TPM domain-containing protein [Planctomycetota bacterium]